MRFIFTCLAMGLGAGLTSYLAAASVYGAVPFMADWLMALSLLSGCGATVLGVVGVANITWRSSAADLEAQQIADARLKQIEGRRSVSRELRE